MPLLETGHLTSTLPSTKLTPKSSPITKFCYLEKPRLQSSSPKLIFLESLDHRLTNTCVVLVVPPASVANSTPKSDASSRRKVARRPSSPTTLKALKDSNFTQNDRPKNPNSDNFANSTQNWTKFVPKPSATFALLCWNLLSVVLFCLALGVSNAQSSATTSSNDYRNNHQNLNIRTFNRHSQRSKDQYSYKEIDRYNNYKIMSKRPKPNSDRVHRTGSDQSQNRIVVVHPSTTNSRSESAWTKVPGSTRATTGILPTFSSTSPGRQCKIFDTCSINALCPAAFRRSAASRLTNNSGNTGRNSRRRQMQDKHKKLIQLNDTYLFPLHYETGAQNLYNFFTLTMPDEGDMVNPTKLRHLKVEYHDCLHPEADIDSCKKCFGNLLVAIKRIVETYDRFVRAVLSKVECTTTKDVKIYSAITTCSLCKTFYRRWLMVTLASVTAKRPCIEWCELAELACPHVTPTKKLRDPAKATLRDVEYAGLPSFRCRDNTIPWVNFKNSSYDPPSPDSQEELCLNPCDTWTKEVEHHPFFKKYCNDRFSGKKQQWTKKKRKHMASLSSRFPDTTSHNYPNSQKLRAHSSSNNKQRFSIGGTILPSWWPLKISARSRTGLYDLLDLILSPLLPFFVLSRLLKTLI